MAEPLFRRLALIGIGRIGSSVARIARERGDLAGEVVVNARTTKTMDRVRELGFADRIEADVGRAVAGADCVMLCAPVGAFAELAAAIAPHLEPGAVLTDVGSTKQSVIRDVGPLVPAGVHFVPAHPVAGTEYSGPDAGFVTLFEGRCPAAVAFFVVAIVVFPIERLSGRPFPHVGEEVYEGSPPRANFDPPSTVVFPADGLGVRAAGPHGNP